MDHDAIAVVDFGGQYAHLIATKIRRLGVLAEIRQPEDPLEWFRRYKGIVISGSPSLSSHGEDSEYTKAIYDLDVPIIGFCFGHQELAKHYGGQVVHGGREWARTNLILVREHPLFSGLDARETVWMSHFDSVVSLGPEFVELGFTRLGEYGPEHRFAAIASDSLRRYGFQFHPEVDDTLHGEEMIANFLFRICGCRPTWTMDNYLEEQGARIREQVGERSVFLLASGGVDSTVAAMLIGKALGPGRLRLLHIDNGLMRRDESRKVLAMFRDLGLADDLHFVDAGETFLAALKGVIDPEAKRKIIGNTFIEVFEAEARRLGIEDHLLGQGTIYPDTIETGGTKRADTIKTHHNRVPLISRMIAEGRVVEPLVELYKAEVRQLGAGLGIPEEVIGRHPFPGPGLGVRLLCSDGEEDSRHARGLSVDAAGIARRFELDAAVLPVKSVGVKADLRSYEHPVMLFGQADWNRLSEAAGTILKEVPGVNRCVWNLGPGRPREFRPLAATVERKRLDLLREADQIVTDGMKRHGIYDQVWQCPVVLVPMAVDGRGRELCILRPVRSERAMTASAAEFPPELLDELCRSILPLEGISGVAIDLTSKPPGTIEWE